MKVVRHDHIREEQETAGVSRFVNSVASYLFYRVGSEDWKTMCCDGGDEKGWVIP